MFFLNLGLGEFLGLLGVLSGLITALYLLDRAKHKRTVSTLRFWTPGSTANQQQSRKRMREPWSLLLQLLSLLLLLLAIAQLEWGTHEQSGRNHVLLLDTSSWSAGQTPRGTLLNDEIQTARQYVSTLPARDRLMLVRVDALASPVTSFTTDRAQIAAALSASVPGFSALNIDGALSFAEQAQSSSGGRGEITYIGPALVSGSSDSAKVSNLRVLSINAELDDAGIRSIGVKRSDDDPNGWQASVTVMNYGRHRRTLRLKTRFAGTAFLPRTLDLPGGAQVVSEYNFFTNTAGQLVSEIDSGDSLPTDDLAVLALPGTSALSLLAYTDRPDVLRPLLDANHHLRIKYLPTSAYGNKITADVLLLDGFAPQQTPAIPALYLNPPRLGSPIPVRSIASDVAISKWSSDTAPGAGLHAKDTHLAHVSVFQTFSNDITVASTAQGPAVVVRSGQNTNPKIAVIGFDPLSGPLRFQITTPLLFSNLLRWLSPADFLISDLTASNVGLASVSLGAEEHPDHLRVTDSQGFAVPFTVRAGTLQLFVSRPSIVQVSSANSRRILSLTLPDIATAHWIPGTNAAVGLPPAVRYAPSAIDLWKWLALLGALGLSAEWFLFGRSRSTIWKQNLGRRTTSLTSYEPELVVK